MIDDSIELRNRIIQLSDEELIEMVEVNQSQYRKEALVYAEAELQRRGLLRPYAAEEPNVVEAPSRFPDSLEGEDIYEEAESDSPPAQSVVFRVFRSPGGLWEDLFIQAAEYASSLGPERVISISHSADQGDKVVTVWHWS